MSENHHIPRFSIPQEVLSTPRFPLNSSAAESDWLAHQIGDIR